ncbi:MAG: hypothetical protein LUE99_02740 [Bacteroides sp.]|nr:hypothetical protein [Bacteroides sp.]
MRKYCICDSNGTIEGEAGSKAPQGVCVALREIGYETVYIRAISKNKEIALLGQLVQLILFSFHVRRDDKVLFQYPLIPILFMVTPLYVHCRNRILLIHDFHSMRLTGRLSRMEKWNLAFCKTIIVHTRSMARYLSKMYPQKEYYVQDYFGYILDVYKDQTPQRKLTNDICFAGNIDKSKFMKELLQKEDTGCTFHLYGKMSYKDLLKKPACIYEGMFHPNKVGFLKGSWGLVWDGDSILTCSGYLGEYLKIIAPHKFSLYLVAGLPVIVWSQSAMAHIVAEKHIGIIINSLCELEWKINSITQEEYDSMLSNVSETGKEIQECAALESITQHISSHDSHL